MLAAKACLLCRDAALPCTDPIVHLLACTQESQQEEEQSQEQEQQGQEQEQEQEQREQERPQQEQEQEKEQEQEQQQQQQDQEQREHQEEQQQGMDSVSPAGSSYVTRRRPAMGYSGSPCACIQGPAVWAASMGDDEAGSATSSLCSTPSLHDC